VNQQLHCLALELLVVSFLNLLFLHGFSLFTLSFRVRKIRGGSVASPILAKFVPNLPKICSREPSYFASPRLEAKSFNSPDDQQTKSILRTMSGGLGAFSNWVGQRIA